MSRVVHVTSHSQVDTKFAFDWHLMHLTKTSCYSDKL